MEPRLRISAQGPKPEKWFFYRRVIKTEICQKNFGQTNEQQRHLN